MKKELQVIGAFNDAGVFEPTHLVVTKSIADHELNSELNLAEGDFITMGNEPGGKCKSDSDCPDNDSQGYYVCSGSNCVYVPYS